MADNVVNGQALWG